MKVFMSWSGAASREVALALGEWIPKVIQGVTPFVSAKDIDKGANWTVELARELTDAQFGIVCLAPDNLLSPWLNYEAGAITRSVESRVCPVLFGVERSDIKPPMSQLQLTLLNKEEILQLMYSLNKVAGDRLSEASLQEAVTVWWPHLEQRLSEIPLPNSPAITSPTTEPEKPQSDQLEMLTEVLRHVRNLDARVTTVETAPHPYKFARATDYILATDPAQVTGETKIARALRQANLEVGSMVATKVEGSVGILVSVYSDLPDSLPGELLTAVNDVAVMLEKPIVLSGLNRRFIFGKEGWVQELQA